MLLLRDSPAGPSTLLLRRVATMAFAPRMHVFPGGRVDPVDHGGEVEVCGDLPALAERASSDVPGLRALYACAVRETWEEVGVDLAVRRSDGGRVVDAAEVPIVGHWVTPEDEPRRYDVRFLAAVVENGAGDLRTTEADRATWLTPADALAKTARGELPMLPPTRSMLRRITGFDRAGEALAALAAEPVRPLLPRRRAGTRVWDLVDARTGEVVQAGIRRPQPRETDGRPAWAASDEGWV